MKKTAIVTGGSRGIGYAIVRALGHQGCQVCLMSTGGAEKYEKALDALTREGIAWHYVQGSLDRAEDRQRLIDETLSAFGRIDILVNNAGITRDTLLMRMTEAQWDQVINVNLKSAFNFTHAATPVMMRRRSGSIISLSSVVGINGNAGQANYAASKAGIIALTKSVAKELGSRGVRANAIAPGFILTDMTKALPEETLKQFVSMIPMRRGGEPEEVAKVALFLASDLSSYVSGQVIQVNGAMA